MWSKQEVQILRANYSYGATKNLSRQLNRTKPSIYHKAERLGLSAGSKVRSLSCCERAHIAALIDGEGSIFIAKGKGKTSWGYYFVPTITIANNCKELLEKAREIIGAGCSPCKLKYWTNMGNRKVGWYFTIHTNAIKDLIPQIIDWLVAKRKHAELILEFVNLSSKRRGKHIPPSKREEEIYWELKKLNRKGKE